MEREELRKVFDESIVEDGKLLTGQNPASAAAVGEAVVKRLTEARCSPST
jgi:putative intracellular protease/amidase